MKTKTFAEITTNNATNYKHAVCLSLLQDEKYYFYQNQSDVDCLLEDIGLDAQYKNNITGAVVLVTNGGYDAIWLSESSRPYELTSTYYALPFYNEFETDNQPVYWKQTNEEYWF